MSYLLEEDYSKIIEKAITTNTEKVGYFFHSEYIRVKESNFDFIECLTKTINELEIRYNEEKEKLIVKESEKEIRLKGYCETDFRDTTDWNETIFWYHNGKVFFEFNFYWKENQYLQFKLSTLNKLITGLDKFNELINSNINDKNNSILTSKTNITLKQKIYLLDKIGFFDLDKVKDLNETEKGKLVSLLLFSSQKNTTDTIREKYSFNEKNQKKSINELNRILTELGIGKL
jgi:hypothetical protein